MANGSRKTRPASAVWHLDQCERRILLCELHAVYTDLPSGVVMGPALPVASSPLSAVPLLHSRPSATAKLYLDFDGDAASTWGSYSVPATPAYDADGDATSFSDQELSNIREIWARVAEKYSAFNLDVTTQYPGDLNDRHALRAVIGGTGSWYSSGSGGVSYVGGFYNSSSNTVYVFSANLGNGNPFYTAEGIAHESGHGFGLQHQSTYSGTTKTAEYNTGDSLRAPIMGSSYYAQRGLWWNGQNSISSTTNQDDLAVISNTSTNQFGYRTDDYGSTSAAAGTLTLSSNIASASGVIEKTSDADWLKFTLSAGGSVSFTASVGSYVRANAGITVAADGSGATLDLSLELRDASGNLIAAADTASLGESVSASGLAAGTYYLVVKSHGSYGDIGTYDVTGTITPNQTSSPTANAGGPYTANEGGSVLLDGGGSTAGDGTGTGLTYLWDLDGDGIFGETGPGATRGDETGISPTFLATGLDGPSTFTISLKVTDAATGLTSSASAAAISIANVPPTPSILGGPAGNTGPEGTAISLTGSANDPGTADTITYAWSVTKNGSAYTTGSGSALAFTPSDNGTYVVTYTATDKDGGVGTASKTITVTNVAPTPSIAGAPPTSTEGSVLNMTGSATDPGTLDTLTYAWSITKDGAAYANGSGSTFSLTPDDDGTYVVTLTVTDKDGGSASTSRTVTVANVAPFVMIGGAPATSPEGTSIWLTSSVTDPGSLDAPFTYAWRVTKDGVAYKSGTASTFMFTPNDNATYVLTLSVTDKDGGVGTDTETISVTNVAPVPSITGAPATSPEGTAIALTGSATDVGTLDTSFTYAWAVTKNGAPYAAGSGAAFSFTPDDDAAYVVSFTATDKDGGSATASRTITVNNVAPGLALTGPTQVSPGTPYTLGLSSSDPGTDTIGRWTIDWGDGTVDTLAGNPTSVTHTYAADGTYPISASAQDEDGTFAVPGPRSVTVVSIVDNVAPTAAFGSAGATTAGAAMQTFTVVYLDNGDMNDASLGDGDVLVTGPNGFSQLARFVSLDRNVDDGGRTVTYSFTPPGGAWSYTANGTYTLQLQPGQVTDAAGNPAPAGALGSFAVRLAVPDLGGNTTAAAAYLGIVSGGYATTSSDFLSKGDRNDYFRLRLKQTTPVDVKLYGMTEDADLQLLDGNGRVVQTSARVGTRSEVITRTLPAGTYYLRAYYGGSSSTPYWLRVSSGVGATALAPDAAGNTLASAAYVGILAPPSIGVHADALTAGDANDYYRFRLKQSAVFDASLYGLTGDAQLALLDSSGNAIRVSRNTGSADEVLSRTLQAGTYYLRVFSDRPVTTQYTLAFAAGTAAAPTVTAAAPPSLLSAFSTQPLAASALNRDLLTGGGSLAA